MPLFRKYDELIAGRNNRHSSVSVVFVFNCRRILCSLEVHEYKQSSLYLAGTYCARYLIAQPLCIFAGTTDRPITHRLFIVSFLLL